MFVRGPRIGMRGFAGWGLGVVLTACRRWIDCGWTSVGDLLGLSLAPV